MRARRQRMHRAIEQLRTVARRREQTALRPRHARPSPSGTPRTPRASARHRASPPTHGGRPPRRRHIRRRAASRAPAARRRPAARARAQALSSAPRARHALVAAEIKRGEIDQELDDVSAARGNPRAPRSLFRSRRLVELACELAKRRRKDRARARDLAQLRERVIAPAAGSQRNRKQCFERGSPLRRAAFSNGAIASSARFCASKAWPSSEAAGAFPRSAFNTSDASRSASPG